MPLATNPKIFQYCEKDSSSRAIFVASKTILREKILSQINHKITIAGNGWNKDTLLQHNVSTKACSIKQTALLYQSHNIAINIKNENNVVNGVNQRSFDPCACGCLLIHDYVADLENLFDIEKEILVYQNVHELESIYDRILKDHNSLKKVADKGRQKTLSEHTFHKRVQIVLMSLGFI